MGGWGGSALSRCHPRIAAPGTQRLPALLRTRAREEPGKRPAFQREAPGATPSRALQDFPGTGAGAAESRAALTGLPPVRAKWDSPAAPTLTRPVPGPCSPLSPAFTALDRFPERNLRLASPLGPYPFLPRERSWGGDGGQGKNRDAPLASRRALLVGRWGA